LDFAVHLNDTWRRSIPTVSVIVPRRPDEPYFDECKASIRKQTYKDIKPIVITDRNGRGPAWARNEGLKLARGKYVAFVDADDYLAPDAIEKMVKAIDGVDMVCGGFRKFGLFEQVVKHKDKTFTPDELAEYVMGNLRNPRSNQMLSGCWAKLYRRELVGLFPPFKTAEDMAFNFEYLYRANSVRFIPDIVYHNRKRKGSLTTSFDEKDKFGLFGVNFGLGYVDHFMRQFYGPVELLMVMDHFKGYHSMLYFMRIVEATKLPMNEVFKKLYP